MRRLNSRRFAPRLLLAASVLALLGACSTVGGKKGSPRAPAANPNPTYQAPTQPIVGRIVFFDPTGRVAVMEFSPWASLPSDLAGRALLSRHPDTLARTADLVASLHRTGSVLGVYVITGIPQPGDEVVLAPSP